MPTTIEMAPTMVPPGHSEVQGAVCPIRAVLCR